MRAKVINAHAAALTMFLVALALSQTLSSGCKALAAALIIAGATFGVTVVILFWFIELFPELEIELVPCKSAFADYAGLWGSGAVLLMLVAEGKMPSP